MEFQTVKINRPEGANVILGMSHFIKTVEDIYEVLISACPNIKFGLGFCESSGPCLVRTEGNDQGLKKLAGENALNIGAGHSFIVILEDAFPINVLNAVKNVSEVCVVYCATANSVEVIVAENGQGRGIIGVIDGLRPKGIEGANDVKWRKDFLRKVGYKQ